LASIALSPVRAANRAFSGAIKASARNIRWTVLISIVLIFGSFVSAAVIQMRRDRVHALDQAAMLESRRAAELAADFAATFDRYAALGGAFANAQTNAETSAALSETGGPALQNIVVLDRRGHALSEMKRAPKDLLPLARETLSRAAAGRLLLTADRGSSILLAFPHNDRLLLVQLAAKQLFPSASMGDAVLATRQGQVLLIGRNWHDLPSREALAVGSQAETRIFETASDRRLVALAHVAKWPIAAGASVQVGEVLSGWYGTLPLYFFFILGPAFAGAGLAVVFVRELERRTRPHARDRMLKARRNEEARLLIRLADAERRAAEADRSKTEFITHMSHELRTPLNAIIGFAEVIEQGLFGKAGHPKYEEYAHDIKEAGQTLHAQIDEILEFANLETGKQAMAPSAMDVSASVRHAAEEAAGRAFSRQIRIAVSLADNVRAIADAPALKRALNNLLFHALQRTRDGGLVRIQVRAAAEAVLICIQESIATLSAAGGIGRGNRQSEAAVTSNSNALRLAIASSLVRRMGGNVSVSSMAGEGDAIEIRLRRA